MKWFLFEYMSMGDCPWGYSVCKRVEMNIENLSGELPGPRPLRRVMDIDIGSKSRIWSRGQPSKLWGREGPQSRLLQPHCTLASTSTHDYPTGVREVEGLGN